MIGRGHMTDKTNLQSNYIRNQVKQGRIPVYLELESSRKSIGGNMTDTRINLEHVILDWQEGLEATNRGKDILQSDRRLLASLIKKTLVAHGVTL